MNTLLKSICLLVAGAALTVSAAEPPNILFILADDLPWSGTGVAMHPDLPETSRNAFVDTPALSRLAAEGVRFSDAYAPAPICTPTRRSVLCGMTPARQRGTEFGSTFDPTQHLTIPKALKLANPAYQTAHFGKWGENMGATPEQAGYDVSDGETGNVTGDSADPKDPKLTSSVTGRAVNFIQKSAAEGKPFYAQVSYYAVHLAIQALPETVKKYEQRGRPTRHAPTDFYAMLEELDQGVGQLLSALDSAGIADNTWVIFSSDNGGKEYEALAPNYLESLREPTSVSARQSANRKEPLEADLFYSLPDNAPLRGVKQTLFEGGIRVPFLARGPGVVPGTFQRQPIALYELLPTFYELAGGTEKLPDELDGASLVEALKGQRLTDEERTRPGLVFHRPRAIKGFGKGYSALRHRNYKLILSWDDKGEVSKTELFRLDHDLREAHDLSTSDPDRTESLRKKLLDYLAAVNAEKPQDRIKKNPAK